MYPDCYLFITSYIVITNDTTSVPIFTKVRRRRLSRKRRRIVKVFTKVRRRIA